MAADGGLLIADLAVGVVLFALGVAAARWQASGAPSRLLMAAGTVWLLADVLPAATFWHRALLVHLVLAYPDGRLQGAVRQFVVVAFYLCVAAYLPARNDAVTAALSAAVVSAAAQQHLRARGPARRGTAVALVGAALLATAFSSGGVLRLVGAVDEGSVLATYDVLIVAVCVLMVGDIRWQRVVSPPVTALVVDLGEAASSDVLRDRLASGLGDPTLEIGYWVPARERYVDESGRDLVPAAAAAGRSVTPVSADGRPLAVLVHDPDAALADPRVVADVAAAARWAIANVRLRADVRERVAGVAASRRRLVTAADDERLRWEGMLQRGVEERLARVRTLVTADGSGLAGLTDAVDRIRLEVRQLALGLHPRTLATGGLGAALQELTRHCAVPVELEVPASRLPPLTETAVYYICAEALANTVKYADASAVLVRVTVSWGRRDVTVAISDDGCGGADLTRGSGLRGIADRAEAAGGRLMVQSPTGHGTLVVATLPLSAPEQIVVASP